MSLTETDDLVMRIGSFEALKPPHPQSFRSYSTWMRTNNPLTEDDASFLNRDDDFIALADDYEYGLLDNLLERGISRWTSRIVTLE